MALPHDILDTITAFRSRFHLKNDSEYEQAFIRLVIGIVLGTYFTYATLNNPAKEHIWRMITAIMMVAFLLVSIALIIAVALNPKKSIPRRLVGIASDTGTITYFIFANPEFGAPLYCIYLWIIIGNGFRFGSPYLFVTLALSLAGFGAGVLILPYWSDKLSLGAGLWAGMLAISLYLSTLAKRLMTSLGNAESANLAKRRFVSSISHEMRTPLNAIIGMADLMKSTQLTRDQEEMLHGMDSASKLMLSLVEDVLDFSKIEAGKLVVEKISFDLHQLITDTTNLFKYQASERGLVLVVDMAADVPSGVAGDPTHLRQVLANFLSNALKFTKEGSVTLRISALGINNNQARLLFEVEDTGIGIAPQAKAHIFDSFTQADASTTRQYGGTGLGTTIAKQLVELMGGRIGFRSEQGIGSTFWFELDLQLWAMIPKPDSEVLPQAQRSGAYPSRTMAKPAARRIQYKILVAEDNAMNRKVIGKILEREGHSCIIVSNGEEALDMLEITDFDIVILDMNMPELSGLEVIKAYKFHRPEMPHTPFIILSADATQELKTECLGSGCDEFLSKPIQVGLLLGAIDRLVAQHGQILRDRTGAGLAPDWVAQGVGSAEGSALLNYAILDQLRHISQDTAFLNNLVAEFLFDTRNLVVKLESALIIENVHEIKKMLHALKGSALSIGALSFHAICQKLEGLPRGKLLENREELMFEIRQHYDNTEKALNHYRRHHS